MITDDELLLYHYRELESAERARIAAALATQPDLAQRLHRLVARLDAVADVPDVPVPLQVHQRWRKALDEAARADAPVAATRAYSWIRAPRWQAAAAAVVVATLALTIYSTRPTVTPPGDLAAQAPPDAAARATPYERGLSWHLASTERQLASLEEASPEERARLVETIIGQNRLFALAAERAGEPQLARVLRAFTPILESVAAGHEEATANGVAQLSFEMRVMQARLGAGADSKSNIY